MNIPRWSKPAVLILAALLLVSLFGASVSAQCGCNPCGNCNPCCPDRSSALSTAKATYQLGEEVTFSFSNPQDYDVVFENIYIQRWQPLWYAGNVVYSREFVDFDIQAIPGTSWTWTWDQKSSWGNQVSAGRYRMVIETLCCGTYQVSFEIAQGCPEPCGQPCYTYCWSYCRPCWPCWRPCYPQPTCLESKSPDFFIKHFVNPYEYKDKKLRLRIKDHVMAQLLQMADSVTFRLAPADTVIWTQNGAAGWRNDSLSEIGLSMDPATGKISGDLSSGAHGKYFFFVEALNSEGEVVADIWIELAIS